MKKDLSGPVHLHVACAIVEDRGLVLAAQRGPAMSLPLKWEFPGGKIRSSESPDACLRRELKEELELDVSVLEALMPATHRYPTFTVTLHPFRCAIESGSLTLHEHAAVRWLAPEQLPTLDWAEADLPVIGSYLAQKRGLAVVRGDVPAAPGVRAVVVPDAPERTHVSAGDVAHLEIINELSGIINSSLSIGTIFRMVVKELRNLIDYSRASLLLYREKQDDLLIFALDTEMQTTMTKGVRAPMEGTSAGWVVRNNKPWISRDLQETPFPLDCKLLLEGIRSTISIPLSHDRMLGVFNFDSTIPNLYSERDLELLLPVAKHIAIALENAILFEEISHEKKEWERTFDAITDMVWIEDGKRRIVRANRTLLQKTGCSAAEITSRDCDEVLERLGIASTPCLCDKTRESRRPSSREFKNAAGSNFQFWAYPLIDEEGKLYAIVHYLKDVTGQKQMEQQLIRSERLASLGTLVAGIAHEINNPLGIIAGYAEALLDRADDPELRAVREFEDFPEYLRTIHHEIFRCKSILQSLLEFARPSGGTFREIDVNELIKEVLLLLQHRTARLQHRIDLRLTRDLPKISADAGSLRQVLMNLLLNAISFTPEGGSITIATAADDAQSGPGPARGSRRIRLTVRDTGAGIAPEIAGKIFDPFFTTKPVGEGTGLGLTISHRIVEEHGGSIDVESAPGKGTAFVITLPSAGRP